MLHLLSDDSNSCLKVKSSQDCLQVGWVEVKHWFGCVNQDQGMYEVRGPDRDIKTLTSKGEWLFVLKNKYVCFSSNYANIQQTGLQNVVDILVVDQLKCH